MVQFKRVSYKFLHYIYAGETGTKRKSSELVVQPERIEKILSMQRCRIYVVVRI